LLSRTSKKILAREVAWLINANKKHSVPLEFSADAVYLLRQPSLGMTKERRERSREEWLSRNDGGMRAIEILRRRKLASE
jgi:hypothetical protein